MLNPDVVVRERQRWRTSIARAAEAMTIFAVMCAGLFPIIHMGRPWLAHWALPYPSSRGPLWVNFRSPSASSTRSWRSAERCTMAEGFTVLVFGDPEPVRPAVRALRGAGFDVYDVYSPFPLHGLDEDLRQGPSRLSRATLAGGLLGGTLAVSFMAWVHTTSWPLVIGGKPPLALPALVPITFEMTVLVAGRSTVAALFVRERLRPRFRESPRLPHPRVTSDTFAVVVRVPDGASERLRTVCDALRPMEVIDGWR